MITVRTVQPGDAPAICQIIQRNLHEINSRDYSEDCIQWWSDYYSPDEVKRFVQESLTVVAEEDETVVGTCSLRKNGPDVLIHALYVLPERHGQGIGRILLNSLENTPLFRQAEYAVVDSSITARGFYEKMGYSHLSGKPELIDNDHYTMRKKTADAAANQKS